MRSALIFGGTGGIGRAVADAFICHGFAVSVVSRTQERVEKTIEGLSQKGLARGWKADVSNYNEVESVLNNHLSCFENLEVVINTAAVQGPIGPIWEIDAEAWSSNVLTNLVGSFNICRVALPFILKSGQGTIILFSGGGAAYARPNFSAYGASKTGVLRLVENIHVEILENLGNGPALKANRDVRVYAVAPGLVNTRMTEEVLANKEHMKRP
jgi:3-oxoacyl-[acyl-carrier protein] reductase